MDAPNASQTIQVVNHVVNLIEPASSSLPEKLPLSKSWRDRFR
jgi:hypothetical protein